MPKTCILAKVVAERLKMTGCQYVNEVTGDIMVPSIFMYSQGVERRNIVSNLILKC